MTGTSHSRVDASGADRPQQGTIGRVQEAEEQGAHLLPIQGLVGVFVHHNTLHAFEDLPFQRAVIEASQLFGAEPYMTEAAYRAELARGRFALADIDLVLDGEPDVWIFPRLSKRSLRRAMIVPGVRELDAATILWRAERGDLAWDFRRTALRSLFDVCARRAAENCSNADSICFFNAVAEARSENL